MKNWEFQVWMSQTRIRPYVVFLLLAILPLVLFLYSAYRAIQRDAEKRATEDSAQIAALTARLTEEKITDSKAFLEAFATRDALVQAWVHHDLKEVTSHLKQAAALRRDFVFVSIYEVDGTMRAMYPPDSNVVNRNFAFRDWYRGVSREWRPYVSEVYQTAVAPHQLVAAIAVPLKDPHGKVIGVLMAPYDVATIGGWLQKIVPLGSARSIVVVDQAGHILAQPGIDSFKPVVDLSTFEPVARVRAGQAGQGSFQRNGDQLLVAYAPMPDVGWGALAELQGQSISLSTRDFARHLILLGLVFIGLAIGCGGFVASLYKKIRDSHNQIATQNQQLELSNREVERATRLKSEFLANMSHELRTPLNAIIGFSELLSSETVVTKDEKYKRWIGHIEKSGRHLLRLVNDILDLSKIEAGHIDLEIEHFPLEAAIPEVLSNIRYLAMAKKIAVEVDTEPDIVLLADRVRFKQILYNLLNNAVKFTPEDGEIRLKVQHNKNFVFITVADTGIGILEEDQKVIFDEFRQVGEMSRTVEGTGLGLAITKRLVERLGGTIEVKSEIGKGSRFTFTVPAGKTVSEVGLEPPATFAPPIREIPLILIVESEAPVRQLLISYLASGGFQIETASSGPEALEKAAKLLPDAITINMLLPGRSGWATLHDLKRNPSTSGIPVLIVSIIDNKGRGFALGAAEYLVRPVQKDILLTALRKHLGPRSPQTILVVDDDPASLQLATQVLERERFIVLNSQSGKEALSIMSRTRVDAVLLDLMMPEMDGFEVLRRIRDDSATSDMPVFILTAADLTESDNDFLQRATQGFFKKGDSWREELLAQVRKTVGRANIGVAASRTFTK